MFLVALQSASSVEYGTFYICASPFVKPYFFNGMSSSQGVSNYTVRNSIEPTDYVAITSLES